MHTKVLLLPHRQPSEGSAWAGALWFLPPFLLLLSSLIRPPFCNSLPLISTWNRAWRLSGAGQHLSCMWCWRRPAPLWGHLESAHVGKAALAQSVSLWQRQQVCRGGCHGSIRRASTKKSDAWWETQLLTAKLKVINVSFYLLLFYWKVSC